MNIGDQVALICNWDTLHIPKQVMWWKMNERTNQIVAIWVLEENYAFNEAMLGFRDKLEHSEITANHHELLLLNASDSDEGRYWCTVNVSNILLHTSYSRRLDVQGIERCKSC